VEEALIGPAQEIPGNVEKAVEAIGKLNYAKCDAEVRERFEDDISNLRAGLSFRDRDFWVQFLAPATIIEHLPPGGLLVVDEMADIQDAIADEESQSETNRAELEERGEIPRGLPRPFEAWAGLRGRIESTGRLLELSRWAMPEGGAAGGVVSAVHSATAYGGVQLVLEAISNHRRPSHVVVTQRAHRLAELLGAVTRGRGNHPDEPPLITVVLGSLARWKLAEGAPALLLLTDSGCSGSRSSGGRRQSYQPEAFLAELTGDIVHIDHGIAKFRG
jgi:hypothetical protein